MKDKLEALIISAVAKLSDTTKDEYYALDFLEYLMDIVKDIKIGEVDNLNTIKIFKRYMHEYTDNNTLEEFSIAIDELLNKENISMTKERLKNIFKYNNIEVQQIIGFAEVRPKTYQVTLKQNNQVKVYILEYIDNERIIMSELIEN